MNWQMYRWIWKVKSPLHLGISPAGILNRTRLYIPARTMWGALTAEISRRRNEETFPSYEQIGNELRNLLRFSYLYPAFSSGDKLISWYPRYTEDGLIWQKEDNSGKKITDPIFRKRLITAFPSTAIDPNSDTAEDGSLREMECIQTHWLKDSEKSPVYFVGYVFFRNASSSLSREVLEIQELFLGADTRYGFGRIKRVNLEDAEKFFGKDVNLNARNPEIVTDIILAHVPADSIDNLKGAYEYLESWDRGRILTSGLAWTPGSFVDGDRRFRIDQQGLWFPDNRTS